MAKTIEITESQIAELIAWHKSAEMNIEMAKKNNGHNLDVYMTYCIAFERCMNLIGIDWEQE